jgi:membrane protein DedA with SNARE-associated domain
MAGLTRMPFPRFLAATACGALPLGLAFATLGGSGLASPAVALSLGALAPPALWLLLRPVVRRLLA